MTAEDRLKDIRASFAQAEEYGHGCDGCGCSCCGAVEFLLAALAAERLRGLPYGT